MSSASFSTYDSLVEHMREEHGAGVAGGEGRLAELEGRHRIEEYLEGGPEGPVEAAMGPVEEVRGTARQPRAR